MRHLPGILALLIAIAGWFYMFYSRAAANLESVEDAQLNGRRIRLRRVGGFVMLLLSIAFFALFYTFDPDRDPAESIATLLAVLVLLCMILVLGLVDLRLTMKLRRSARNRNL
jgi:drug/metabolite transporter (DMT)-like permease